MHLWAVVRVVGHHLDVLKREHLDRVDRTKAVGTKAVGSTRLQLQLRVPLRLRWLGGVCGCADCGAASRLLRRLHVGDDDDVVARVAGLRMGRSETGRERKARESTVRQKSGTGRNVCRRHGAQAGYTQCMVRY